MANLYPTFKWNYSILLSSAVETGDNIILEVNYQNSITLPMNRDFSDIRFDDGTNQLPYWIIPDSIIEGVSCKVVVKLLSSATTIYMYWGNESATSESSISNTCPAGQVFDGTTLNDQWIGTATVSNGYVKIVNGNNIRTSATFRKGHEIISRIYAVSSGAAIGFGISAPWLLVNCSLSNTYYQLGAGTSGTTLVNTVITFDGKFHNFRLGYLNTSYLIADTNQAITANTNIPDTELPLSILGTGDGSEIRVAYIAVRKIPTFGDPSVSWGVITDNIPPIQIRVSPALHPKGGRRYQGFNIIATDGSLRNTCTNPVIKCSVNGGQETTENWDISLYNNTLGRFLCTVIDPGTWEAGDNIEINISCNEGIAFIHLTVFSQSVTASDINTVLTAINNIPNLDIFKLLNLFLQGSLTREQTETGYIETLTLDSYYVSFSLDHSGNRALIDINLR